jgi:DNA-binding transcriptional LysR family regulator
MHLIATMDLRRLAHIVALAEERHFGRAAEKVHLSQPAFSRSIQSAESEVGLPLFDRGPIEATPTAAGLLVLERARRLLFESRCLQRDVTLFREQKLGDMAFGVGPFPAATLLPGLLVALRTRLPAIRTRVMVNNWGVLVEQLRAEELDFFVADIRDVPRDGDLEVRLCGRQTGRLYVRRGHPLLQHQRLTAAQVAPYGLASVRLPVSVQAQMRLALGLEPQDRLPVALECDDIPLLKQVCLESDTVLAGCATLDAKQREWMPLASPATAAGAARSPPKACRMCGLTLPIAGHRQARAPARPVAAAAAG